MKRQEAIDLMAELNDAEQLEAYERDFGTVDDHREAARNLNNVYERVIEALTTED